MPSNAELANRLLSLKLKACNGLPWTNDDITTVKDCLQRDDVMRILAACCVLSSRWLEDWSQALGIVRVAIERTEVPPYAELLIYEALTSIRRTEMEPYWVAILRFIEKSLERRSVSLVNAVAVLGIMGRAGEPHAIALLKSLTEDSDAQVRSNAILILKDIGISC